MLLEIIACSIEDIKNINNSRADRIELCEDLKYEGLTPSINLIKKALQFKKQKIMVMLRKHYGNFLINNKQLKELVYFIKQTKDLPFAGYVFGAINERKEVDVMALKTICKSLSSTNKTLTFHKAFDLIENKEKALGIISGFQKVKNILTSGGLNGFQENINILKKLHLKNPNKILIGGGVTLENLPFLLENGFLKIHIGKEAREERIWDASIKISKINLIKEKMFRAKDDY